VLGWPHPINRKGWGETAVVRFNALLTRHSCRGAEKTMAILKLVKCSPEFRTGNIQNNVRSVRSLDKIDWYQYNRTDLANFIQRWRIYLYSVSQRRLHPKFHGYFIVFGLKIFFPGMITVNTKEVDAGRNDLDIFDRSLVRISTGTSAILIGSLAVFINPSRWMSE
jgi:hypothetical protein